METAILGHCNSAGSPAVEGSPNVFIGGVPVLRVGDHFADGSLVTEGAPDVLINGKAAARLGDPVSEGQVVAQGCKRVRIGNGGGPGYGREMFFKSLTDPKDKLILCLPEIAAAEYERASERDKPGWALFYEGINKWLARPAYSIRDKYDNGGQEPAWVEWDWLMKYKRFRDTVDVMLDREYMFGPMGGILLLDILKKDGLFEPPFDGIERPFDHTVLPWNELRSHAFQSKSMDSNRATWLADGGKPDGLAIIGQLTLLAVARGSTKVNEDGGRQIRVDAVGLFIHDGFEFSGDQWLGNWKCSGTSKEFATTDAMLETAYESINKELGLPSRLDNRAFRNFRARTGHGCDFRIMNIPELFSVYHTHYFDSIEKIRYDTNI